MVKKAKTVDFTNMSRDEMQNLIIDLMDKNAKLEAEIDHYLEALKLQRSRMYSRSTEQSDSLQLAIDFVNFFNEAEDQSDPDAKEPELYDCIEKRHTKKSKGTKKNSTKKLPVKRIEYRLNAEDMVCEKCGSPLETMKKTVRKEFTVIPAQVYVTEHIQYHYVCRNCSKNGGAANFVKASAPEPVLRNSLASPSMLAWILSRKFVESVPLYRQEQQHIRNGLNLSRQTMANWQMKSTELYLEPLYYLMHKDLIKRGILHADETPLEVLHEPGREASDNSYVWVYCTAGSDRPMVLYEYSATRAHTVPEKFLKGFSGYLITDGYAAYNTLTNRHPEIINANCWAHLKRKYAELVKAIGKDVDIRKTESSKAIKMIDSLFAIEREIGSLTYDEKLNARKERSLPVVDAYFAWAKDVYPKAVGNSTFAKAVAYGLEREKALRRFLEDGRIEISNNRAEREVKKFVIGRKNWIFANTPRGANSSTIAYSLIMTAIMNDLDPFRYLTYLFEKMAGRSFIPEGELRNYLPWSTELPAELKSKSTELPSEETEY